MLFTSPFLLLSSLPLLTSAAHSFSPRGAGFKRHFSLKQRAVNPWVCSDITRVGSDKGGIKWVACIGEDDQQPSVSSASSSLVFSTSSFFAEPTALSISEPAPTTTTEEAAPPVETTQAAVAAVEEPIPAETQPPPPSSYSPSSPSETTSTAIPAMTHEPATTTSLAETTETSFVAPGTTILSPPAFTTTAFDPPPPVSTTFVASPEPSTEFQQAPEPTATPQEAAPTVETIPAPVQAVVVEQSSSSSGSADQSRYLAAHNSFRALYGAGALTWSDSAASAAQSWANKCVFEHGGGKAGGFGENLAAGTGSYSIESAISAWTDEASAYNPSNPQFSHFTQVVWKATAQVGCAVASCDSIFPGSTAQFFVCEYAPPGNVAGQFGTNVGTHV